MLNKVLEFGEKCHLLADLVSYRAHLPLKLGDILGTGARKRDTCSAPVASHKIQGPAPRTRWRVRAAGQIDRTEARTSPQYIKHTYTFWSDNAEINKTHAFYLLVLAFKSGDARARREMRDS